MVSMHLLKYFMTGYLCGSSRVDFMTYTSHLVITFQCVDSREQF